MREDRTILLSTHFMEEADALSDRLIILSKGKIRANDRINQLKQTYGSGYKIILNTDNDENHQRLLEILRDSLPNSMIDSESTNQLIIKTNEERSELLIEPLYQLDSLKENRFILNYGVSNSSLGSVGFVFCCSDEKSSVNR